MRVIVFCRTHHPLSTLFSKCLRVLLAFLDERMGNTGPTALLHTLPKGAALVAAVITRYVPTVYLVSHIKPKLFSDAANSWCGV